MRREDLERSGLTVDGVVLARRSNLRRTLQGTDFSEQGPIEATMDVLQDHAYIKVLADRFVELSGVSAVRDNRFLPGMLRQPLFCCHALNVAPTREGSTARS